MLERVARAIENALDDAISNMRQNPDEGPYPSDFLEAARAALEAMMEPTPKQIEAAYTNLAWGPAEWGDSQTPDADPALVWQAMIQAELDAPHPTSQEKG